MQRIKRLVAGRESYIIPGAVHSDDLTVSQMLGVPLLGPDSRSAETYSNKIEARKLLSEAEVPTPPYVTGVVSETQLLEELASLVASYPLIRCWIFKLPRHSRGRGFAECVVAEHLKCYKWLVRESERYGTNWSSKWAQEGARRRILQELPRILSCHANPVNTDHYSSWQPFLADFLASGGIIEGHPPSSSVTSLTVDLFIDPLGEVSITSTQDQINGGGYSVWGGSVPQCSVPPQILADSAIRVGVVCSGRGILGYLSIDFITFIHPNTMEQVLWAVDIDLGYSNHLAMLRLLSYVTMATLDPSSGQLMVEDGPRYAVVSPRVYHSSLPVVHYDVFSQICKANQIGYDAKEKVGTLFALFDREHKENIGIICIQRSLSDALTNCSFALSTIHHELSTPNTQGMSNFKNVCKELDTVAELVKQNTNENNNKINNTSK